MLQLTLGVNNNSICMSCTVLEFSISSNTFFISSQRENLHILMVLVPTVGISYNSCFLLPNFNCCVSQNKGKLILFFFYQQIRVTLRLNLGAKSLKPLAE